MPDFSFEQAAGGIVAGIDEAGRGPWAGPVIAAAVILDQETLSYGLRKGLDDSKKLPRRKRESLFDALLVTAQIGVGRAEVAEVDAVNILRASMLAMARAIDHLGVVPDVALVDGNSEPVLPCRRICIVRGDQRSLSIAAASIIAKVTRDRHMAELGASFPGYGWEHNAGYGTAEHRVALERLGVSPHHRRSFSPINKMLTEISA